MDVKPACYDSVPACLCMKCQLYDVQQMVRAKSSLVSSRSPFLPRYAASLLSRPPSKSAPCAVSSALSSRPTCSVAVSTSGLADVDALKSAREPVCELDCPPRRPFLSRPRLDFADVSLSCFSPAASSGSVLPVVSSVGPAPVVSSPVPSSCPGSGSFVAPRPVPRVCPARPRPVPSSRFAAPRYVPASRVWSSPVGASPLRLLPFVPMVLFVFPVLLSTPFGFALSFVPLLC